MSLMVECGQNCGSTAIVVATLEHRGGASNRPGRRPACTSDVGGDHKKMADGDMIVNGAVDPRPLPEESLGEYLLGRLKEHGDKVAQINAATGAQKTFSRLREEALAIAGGLQELGVAPGDVVMMACLNHPDYATIMLGTLCAGATFAPVNPALDRSDLIHLLTLFGPKVVFCESSCNTLPPLVDGPHLVMLNSPSFEALLQSAPFEPRGETNEVAFIMCSSGTTGRPKGVMVSHKNMHAQLIMHRGPHKKHLAALVLLVPTPVFWVSGLLMVLIAIDAGARYVLQQDFTTSQLLRNVAEYKVSFMFLATNQLVALVLDDTVADYDLSSLRLVTFGGVALSQDLLERAQRHLRIPVLASYGMTEILGVTRSPGEQVQGARGCCGVLESNVQAKVIDLETGKALGPGQEGELCFRGPTVMLGYYRNTEATAEAIDSEGWMHTGDVGYYNKDGCFFVMDRIKSLIKYRGVHIPPAEAEGALLCHPAVQDAAVVGVDHDLDQMHAVGCVVLRPGASASPNELVGHVAELLSPLKHLHGGVKILKTIPRTGTGKVIRRELCSVIGL